MTVLLGLQVICVDYRLWMICNASPDANVVIAKSQYLKKARQITAKFGSLNAGDHQIIAMNKFIFIGVAEHRFDFR